MTNFADLGSTVKMRLYSLQKRHFAIIFASFFLILSTAALIGLFGPQIMKVSTARASKLDANVKMKSGPFSLRTPTLSKFHQQLWFSAQVQIEQRKEEFSKNFTINLHIHNDNDKEDAKNHLEYFNRSRVLHCQYEKCDDLALLHLDYLHLEKYLIELKFYDLDDSSININDIIFNFKSYNPVFTKLELWVRFVFLLITFVVLILYTNSLNKYAYKDWSIEQKWMFVLLRALLFYNNPLFPLTVLVDGWIPHVLDAIFQTSFLCLILLFWLSIYHGFRQHDRNCFKFYFPKTLLVGLIWFIALIIAIFQKYRAINDPTYNLSTDEENYLMFQIMFFIFVGLYALYLLFLVVRSFTELRNMPFFDIRLKFSLSLMLIVIMTCTITSLTRIQVDSFKQNLFEHITKNYRNTFEFCLIFTLFNFYVFILAFIYSPAKNSAYDTDYNDNPTFAMLNDSDEDVIYGSDTEEIIKKPTRKS